MRGMSDQDEPTTGPDATGQDTTTGQDTQQSQEPAAPRDADELTDAVTELGADDEERLDAVAEHNASLEERLPGDDELPLTKG